MKLRQATLADAEELGALHVLSWQAAYAGVFPASFLSNLRVEARVRWFERRVKGGTPILVADSDSGIAGFCLIGPSEEPGWGEIFAIYVDPSRWGGGYGHALLNEAESVLRKDGHSSALLWVLEDNPRARRFYERQGWELAKPIRFEEIGGTYVTERRYEKVLRIVS